MSIPSVLIIHAFRFGEKTPVVLQEGGWAATAPVEEGPPREGTRDGPTPPLLAPSGFATPALTIHMLEFEVQRQQ